MNMLCKCESYQNKLCPFSLGVALGVVKGLCMMMFAWAAYFWHLGLPIVHQVATVYHGFAPTIEGGIWGGLWGLICGFIFGAVLALVYNFCSCCCCCLKSSCKSSCKSDPKDLSK